MARGDEGVAVQGELREWQGEMREWQGAGGIEGVAREDEGVAGCRGNFSTTQPMNKLVTSMKPHI